MATAKSEAFLVSTQNDEGYAIAAFKVGAATRTERLRAPPPLAQNPVPKTGNLKLAKTVTLSMEGGAMGRMNGAIFEGKQLSMRDLVTTGNVWAFNGVAGLSDEPLISVSTEQAVVITIINETGWPHAMHLHGHHFRQLINDSALGPLRDTLLMGRGETTKIAFMADNPGKWLLHCHMLEHAAAGMMTWLEVL